MIVIVPMMLVSNKVTTQEVAVVSGVASHLFTGEGKCPDD